MNRRSFHLFSYVHAAADQAISMEKCINSLDKRQLIRLRKEDKEDVKFEGEL